MNNMIDFPLNGLDFS